MPSGVNPFPVPMVNNAGSGRGTFPPPRKRHAVALTVNKAVLGLIAMRRDVEINESPIYLTAGETRLYTVTFEQGSIVASTSAKIYKNGSDVTSINMSGATSVSGNVVTLPTIGLATALIGGERYVLEVAATVDGVARIVAAMLIVRLNGAELA